MKCRDNLIAFCAGTAMAWNLLWQDCMVGIFTPSPHYMNEYKYKTPERYICANADDLAMCVTED